MVFEIPEQFIDPDLFECHECLQGQMQQLPLDEKKPRQETRPYDPAQATLGF